MLHIHYTIRADTFQPFSTAHFIQMKNSSNMFII